jgi:hypothetical protein
LTSLLLSRYPIFSRKSITFVKKAQRDLPIIRQRESGAV